MRTVEQHLADFHRPTSRGHEYAVAVGKIDVAVDCRTADATDADVLAEIKRILTALNQAIDERAES